MKYSVYFLLVLCLTSPCSFGMCMSHAIFAFFYPSQPRSVPFVGVPHAVTDNTPLQFDKHKKISDEKERHDAASFIACLDGFKSVAEKTLAMHKEGYEKLYDRESAFLKFCIEANDVTRYKVESNRNAVYKKVCSYDLSAPEATTPALRFWDSLLTKKKIDKQLFDEQLEQIKKLHVFIGELTDEGLICQYPRTVGGRTIYKAAL